MSGIVLVTGASGLAGASLVRKLIAQGSYVRALVHEDVRAIEGLDVELVQGDVLDRETLHRAIYGVDVIYHLAGSISLESESNSGMKAINISGTQNVVECCLAEKVRRLVHFSSVDALQHEPFDEPIDETRPLINEGHYQRRNFYASPYNLSKAQGELAIREGIKSGLEAIILRPTAMLGPCDYKPSLQGQALIKLADGKIPALVNGGFDWVDVRDVADAAVMAEQIARPGEIYMLGGNWHTLRDVATLVEKYTNKPSPLITVPMWMAIVFEPLMQKLAYFNGKQPIYTRAMLDVLRGNRQVSSAKANREIGYCARPLAETIHDTLAWFRDHGYLKQVIA